MQLLLSQKSFTCTSERAYSDASQILILVETSIQGLSQVSQLGQKTFEVFAGHVSLDQRISVFVFL